MLPDPIAQTIRSYILSPCERVRDRRTRWNSQDEGVTVKSILDGSKLELLMLAWREKNDTKESLDEREPAPGPKFSLGDEVIITQYGEFFGRHGKVRGLQPCPPGITQRYSVQVEGAARDVWTFQEERHLAMFLQ